MKIGEANFKGLLAIVATLLALLTLPGVAAGRAGALDQSFGGSGRVVVQSNLGGQSWLDAHVDIAEGPDGTIVAAVGKTVFRFLPDGSPDPSFAEGGKLTVADPGGMPFTLNDLAVDADGRVYALGDVQVPDVKVPISYIGGWIHPSLAAVIRYTADGKIDMTYGDGNGYVATDLGRAGLFSTEAPGVQYTRALTSFATGVVDRSSTLTAIASVGELPCSQGHGELEMHKRLIVRLMPEGKLDPSFSEGAGVQAIASPDEIGAVGLAPNGEIAFAGSRTDYCAETTTFGVGRLSTNGKPDRHFGQQGVRALPAAAESIAVDRSGRVLVLLPGSQLLRFTPTGALDRHFGHRGQVSLRLPAGAAPRALAVEPSGGIVLNGTLLGPPRRSALGDRRIPRAFAVAATTSLGRLDRRFGHHGWVTTRFGARSSALGEEAFIDSDGRLVIAGTIARPDLAPTGGIALARYDLGR